MTDKIKKGNVKVAFFPTQEMLADFLQNHSRGSCTYKCEKRSWICPPAHMPRGVLENRKSNVGSRKHIEDPNEERILKIQMKIQKMQRFWS